MTRFTDGPAKGQTLMLKRAPVFLRVTEEAGKFDALNEIDDRPKPTERLHAYVLVAAPGWAFIDGTKCRGRFAMAEYRLCDVPPGDRVMRDQKLWESWVDTVAEKPLWVVDWLKRNA